MLFEANLESEVQNQYVFDECKIKEDLVYNKNTGEVIGFTDITDINNQLNLVEQSYTADSISTPVHRQLATHMLLFMVRGFFHH